MVELESENETTKLSSKINMLNKNVKTLMFSIDKLMEKLDNTKPVEKTPEEEKEKMDKIFAKKAIGRPSGTSQRLLDWKNSIWRLIFAQIQSAIENHFFSIELLFSKNS